MHNVILYKDSVTLYHKRSGGSVVDNMLVIRFDPNFSGLSVLKTEVTSPCDLCVGGAST